MKILYHHRTRSKDGQTVHIDEMTRALRDLGHEIVMVAPGGWQRASFGADAREVGAGGFARLKRLVPGALYELLELLYSIVAFWKLWRAWRQHRPDVLYERYNLFLLSGVWLKRLTGIPFILEVNAPLLQERSKFGGLRLTGLAARTDRIAWRAADRVLPVTGVLADFVRAAGVPDGRIEVVHNGVGPEFLLPRDGKLIRDRYGLHGRIVLGFTGFVRDWHGLDRVIDYMAEDGRAHPVHLLVVGEGPELGNLERRARERGIADRFTCAGIVARHDVPDHIAAYDVALQPQVVPYASPLKLFEYMALGRAIVAPSTSNIREILTDGEDALLFDVDDPHAFRAAIARLVADRSLRDRLGAGAVATVQRHGLTWARNAERVVAMAARLAGRGA